MVILIFPFSVTLILSFASIEDRNLEDLIDDIRREKVSFWEEAAVYDTILSKSDITQKVLARRLGKTQSTISNKLRLLNFTDFVRTIILENDLTERHARAILKIKEEKDQIMMLNEIIYNNLSVVKTEQKIAEYLKKNSDFSHKLQILRENREKAIKLFVYTLKRAIEKARLEGVTVKAAQFDKAEFLEIIIRIPKEKLDKLQKIY